MVNFQKSGCNFGAPATRATAEESHFRIEIFEINRPEQKGELGGQPPELTLLSGSINLEYFYTEIRFSTPTLSALLGSAGQISLS